MDEERIIFPVDTIEDENIFFEDINDYDKYVESIENK